MSIATPTRLDHVQALRGLAALLVLLSHLQAVEPRAVAEPILPASLEWGVMGVDLFFVISGFIMVFVTRDWGREGSAASRIAEFLFARITRIYPLYWVVTAALFAVWLVRPEMVFSSSPNQPTLLNTLFLIPSQSYPLLEVGWTLVYEMTFYLVFALLLFLPARWRGWGLGAWAAIVAAGLAAGLGETNAVAFHLFSPMVFEFLAGAAVGLIYLRWSGSRALAVQFVAVGAVGLLVWFFVGQPFEDFAPRVLRLILPCALLVLGAAWLDRAGVAAPRWSVVLGDWSYSLYLTHVLSLVLVARLWSMAGLDTLPAPIALLVMTGFSLLIAGLTYRLIERPLIRVARRGRGRLFADQKVTI
ncbi:MAG: acyltransferase [Litorimonas sp.]